MRNIRLNFSGKWIVQNNVNYEDLKFDYIPVTWLPLDYRSMFEII